MKTTRHNYNPTSDNHCRHCGETWLRHYSNQFKLVEFERELSKAQRQADAWPTLEEQTAYWDDRDQDTTGDWADHETEAERNA